jgi:hypothetical protein
MKFGHFALAAKCPSTTSIALKQVAVNGSGDLPGVVRIPQETMPVFSFSGDFLG